MDIDFLRLLMSKFEEANKDLHFIENNDISEVKIEVRIKGKVQGIGEDQLTHLNPIEGVYCSKFLREYARFLTKQLQELHEEIRKNVDKPVKEVAHKKSN